MICLRRIPASLAVVLFSMLLVGCAVKQGGMMYEFSDGWLIREYKAPLADTYKAATHAAFSKFVVVEEMGMEENAASLSGVAALSGQPVSIDLAKSGPASTLVSVRVGEAGDRAAAEGVHQALQRYLMP